jgi:ABC-type bacteriocin/lantibiotic exporter with double-glycine peptidase domain
MLAAFQALMLSFLSPVNTLVALGGTIQEAGADLGRLDEVLRNPVEPALADGAATRSSDDGGKLSGQLVLRNVTFGYNRHEPPLIEDFSLAVRPGARVALVGGSGSGKSTVARLAAGLYRPWSGEVLVDAAPLEQIDRARLARSLSMVSQEIVLFEGTVRDNITLWDQSVPEPEVVAAAQDAGLHNDIVARPLGYDGPVIEGGRNWSGGQRQRMEIARALAVRPTLLVLDEATSALDPATEEAVDERLRQRGCTCLIVAHRLSTIRDCDEIIVLEQGRIVQRGTHDELISIDGPYARLIALE